MTELNVQKHQINVNGLNFNVIEKGNGPAVLLLHGFPDTWYMWRNQITALVDAGYRIIAPDMRGFGETDKPEEIEAYELQHLVSDVVGIMDHFKIERSHIISHDWGANVAWAVSSHHSERVQSLSVLASGFPKYDRTIAGYEKSWYVYFFQFEHVAEEAFKRNDWQLFRDWALHHSEIENWIKNLSQPGALRGSMNWYRANYNPAKNFQMPMEINAVDVPVLGLFGIHDPYLEERRMKGSSQYVNGSWQYESFDAGHWLHLDKPNQVNQMLLQFLKEQS